MDGLCGVIILTHMEANSHPEVKRQALRKTGAFNPRAAGVRHVLFQSSSFLIPTISSNSSTRRSAPWSTMVVRLRKRRGSSDCHAPRSIKPSSSFEPEGWRDSCLPRGDPRQRTNSSSKCGSLLPHSGEPSRTFAQRNWPHGCASVSNCACTLARSRRPSGWGQKGGVAGSHEKERDFFGMLDRGI